MAVPAFAANHWIGVGTTAPRAALDIVTTLTPAGSAIIVPSGGTGEIPAPVDGMIRYNTDIPSFEFFGAGGWTPITGYWVKSGNNIYNNNTGGNVGVGTSSPTSRLQVTGGDIRIDGTAKFVVSGRGSLNTDTSGTGIAVESSGATGISFRTGATPANRMVVNNVGNVGIGTTTPAQRLEVNGTIKAIDIILSSDRRLKKDIETLGGEDSLEKVCRLRPVSFAWKANGHPDLGLIAQELRAIYPHLVVEAPDGSLSVRYPSLIAPLVAAAQELNRRQKKLADENAELRARIGKLEEDNKAILDGLRKIREERKSGN
jgi:hypothetical protein